MIISTRKLIPTMRREALKDAGKRVCLETLLEEMWQNGFVLEFASDDLPADGEESLMLEYADDEL